MVPATLAAPDVPGERIAILKFDQETGAFTNAEQITAWIRKH